MFLTGRAWISLGSNIQPEKHLPEAVRQLSSLGIVEQVSQVWETQPHGVSAPDNFCNAAVRMRTELTPQDLRFNFRKIEARLGRVRVPGNRSAPRPIDIDLVLYDGLPRNIPALKLPDPEIASQAYLAIPLAELDAELTPPGWGKTLREIATELRSPDLIRRTDIQLGINSLPEGA